MPQARGIETRSRILQAATDCFAGRGYDATGVAEICRAAGVTKGAFYHHFESKHAVFLQLLEDWLANLDGQLAALRGGAASVPEALQAMTAVVPAILEAARGRVTLFLEFWAQASRDAEVWQATIAPYRRYRDFFVRLIRDGAREGTLRTLDPEVAGPWILSLMMGLLLQGVLDPDGADWGRVAREGTGLLLRDLRQ